MNIELLEDSYINKAGLKWLELIDCKNIKIIEPIYTGIYVVLASTNAEKRNCKEKKKMIFPSR